MSVFPKQRVTSGPSCGLSSPEETGHGKQSYLSRNWSFCSRRWFTCDLVSSDPTSTVKGRPSPGRYKIALRCYREPEHFFVARRVRFVTSRNGRNYGKGWQSKESGGISPGNDDTSKRLCEQVSRWKILVLLKLEWFELR